VTSRYTITRCIATTPSFIHTSSPGYTPYTRLQLLLIIVLAIFLNAVCTLLFAGQDQCNPAKARTAVLLSSHSHLPFTPPIHTQALTAALFSATLSSACTFVARQCFKVSNMAKWEGNELRRAFKMHRKLQARVVMGVNRGVNKCTASCRRDY